MVLSFWRGEGGRLTVQQSTVLVFELTKQEVHGP